MLGYFRSSENITRFSLDALVFLHPLGSDRIAPLDAGANSFHTISITALAGYYYIACIDSTVNCTNVFMPAALNTSSLASAATPISLDSTTDSSISVSGESDYYQVVSGSATTLVISTTGGIDTVGYLYNRDGSQLAMVDDIRFSTDTNFRLSYAIDSGTYYIRVHAFSNRGTGNYALRVSSIPSPPDLAVSTLTASSRNNMAPGTPFRLSTTVSNPGSGNAEATTLYWLSAENPNIPDGEVYSHGTDAIPALVAGSSSSESIMVAASFVGTTYFGACIDAIAGDTSSDNDCATVSVQTALNATTLDATDVTIDINSPVPINGNIELFGESDYYKITVGSDSALTISTSGNTDTYGFLYSRSGTQLAADDQSGEGNNFRISRTVSAGIYYIRVSGYCNNFATFPFGCRTGRYTLSVSD